MNKRLTLIFNDEGIILEESVLEEKEESTLEDEIVTAEIAYQKRQKRLDKLPKNILADLVFPDGRERGKRFRRKWKQNSLLMKYFVDNEQPYNILRPVTLANIHSELRYLVMKKELAISPMEINLEKDLQLKEVFENKTTIHVKDLVAYYEQNLELYLFDAYHPGYVSIEDEDATYESLYLSEQESNEYPVPFMGMRPIPKSCIRFKEMVEPTESLRECLIEAMPMIGRRKVFLYEEVVGCIYYYLEKYHPNIAREGPEYYIILDGMNLGDALGIMGCTKKNLLAWVRRRLTKIRLDLEMGNFDDLDRMHTILRAIHFSVGNHKPRELAIYMVNVNEAIRRIPGFLDRTAVFTPEWPAFPLQELYPRPGEEMRKTAIKNWPKRHWAHLMEPESYTDD